MMFFIYGLIAFLTLSIVAINIQPYKNVAARYSLMDTVFYILLSLAFIGVISRDIVSMGKSFSVILFQILPLLAFIPIIYIAIFISFWIISRMRRIK
jgi:hypothetical protein